MSASPRRHLHASGGGARLVMGTVVGEVVGAIVGLMIGIARYPMPRFGITSAPNGAELGSDAPDDDGSDPRVVWPLLGLAAGGIVGIGAARSYDRLGRRLLDRHEMGRNS